MENKRGRPDTFSQEKADEICELIANGITLKNICDIEGMPKLTTVHKWINEHPDFATAYAHARKTQADTYADMIISEAFNASDAQIGRLRIDALKWTASKLAPKKYGDKIEIDSQSQQNFTLSFSVPDRGNETLPAPHLHALPEAQAKAQAPQVIDITTEPSETSKAAE